MILGLSFATFTLVHVIISLAGIATGIVVLLGMLRGYMRSGWTAIFLATTLLTSLTGFLFPITVFTPALGTGVLSTIILTIALLALYVFHLEGAWRPIYVVTAVAALYLNVFVAVVQAFQKLGPLQELAPTQSEPPFLAAQGLVLALCAIAGFIALKTFRPARPALA
jgi:hypothetical protein